MDNLAYINFYVPHCLIQCNCQLTLRQLFFHYKGWKFVKIILLYNVKSDYVTGMVLEKKYVIE